MRRCAWLGLLGLALSMVGRYPARAQEEPKASETSTEPKPEPAGKKEIKFGATPYFYTGPDTGFGGGFTVLYRDLGGKVGRDTNFGVEYTETNYSSYYLDWSEPDFLKQGPRAGISLSYDNKPSRRFYGFGNDTTPDDICNYNWTRYLFKPSYLYPGGAAQWRVRLQYSYQYVKPEDGTLDDPSEPRFSRPISKRYPRLFHSDQFQGGATAGAGVYLINDTIKDRFPIPGGREERIFPVKGGYRELFLNYNGPTLGSRFEYWLAQADFRQYFGFFMDNTVLVLRTKWIVTQGDVPFWDLPSFGGGSDLRGFYDGRYRGSASSQYNVELRQAIAPKGKLDLFGGYITLKFPFLFAFYEAGRVYDSSAQFGAGWNRDYHPSYGFGLRFIITPDVVIRFEYVFSPEFHLVFDPTGRSFIMNSGEPF